MIRQKSQSAYDLQKEIEFRRIQKWVRVSTPSIYKKVFQLEQKGYICAISDTPGKTIYSVTESGNTYFYKLMNATAKKDICAFFDFNAVIVNLGSCDAEHKALYLSLISESIESYKAQIENILPKRVNIPKEGLVILQQQLGLAETLQKWIRDTM